MSKKFLSPIRLAQGATNPATGSEGELFWNTTDLKVYIHNGTSWAASGGAFTMSPTAPTSPEPKHGDPWFDTSDGSLYVRYVDVDSTGQWVQVQTNSAINSELANRAQALESDVAVLQTQTSGFEADVIALDARTDSLESRATAVESRATVLEARNTSPNYIINGAMDVWQRGTSFAPVTNGSFTADRWQAQASLVSSSRTIQRIALAGDIPEIEDVKYYLRSTVNTIGSGTNTRLRYKVEGADTLAAKTVTFSWYGKQNIAGNYRVLIQQNFGTGGSASVTAYDANATYSTSWQRYSVTFVMPSIVGKIIASDSFIQVELFQADTTGGVLELTAVQFEAGAFATPFRRNAPSIQAELAACQRYYVKLTGSLKTPYNIFNSGNCQTGSIFFPVTMRVAPTSVVVSDSAGTVGKVTIANAGGTQQTNITPPAAMDIYPGWWGYNSGGMGGTTGSTGMMFFNSYEASAEL